MDFAFLQGFDGLVLYSVFLTTSHCLFFFSLRFSSILLRVFLLNVSLFRVLVAEWVACSGVLLAPRFCCSAFWALAILVKSCPRFFLSSLPRTSLYQAVQPEEKARAKDRRSAKTGVRAGGRAPSNTVQGDADVSADPMTYALQQVGDEEDYMLWLC